MRIITLCLFAFSALAAACVAPGYESGYYGAYGSRSGYSGYRNAPPVYVGAPAPMDPTANLCVTHRYCPQVFYYSDTNPNTEKRLAAVEAKVDLQGRQILALGKSHRKLQDGYILLVEFMRKRNKTLEAVVAQNRDVCERFMKKPEAVKDEAQRAKQIQFCEALESAASELGAGESDTDATAKAEASELE